MNRRAFITRLAAALGASAAFNLPRLPPATPSLAGDDNYRALRERLRHLAQRGYQVEGFELEREDNGSRCVRVFVKGGQPLTWHQPWGPSLEGR
jgi:hypothetical protein